MRFDELVYKHLQRSPWQIRLRDERKRFVCLEPGSKQLLCKEGPEWTTFELTLFDDEARGTFRLTLGDGESFELKLCEGKEWKTFNLEPAEPIKVFLRAHGSFVGVESADPILPGRLVANREEPGEWELFTLVPLWNEHYLFKSNNGRYVSAKQEPGLDGALAANRDRSGAWEMFSIQCLI